MPTLFSPSAMTANNLPSPYVSTASQTRSGYNPYFAFAPAGLSGFNPWVTDNVASPTAPSYLEIDIGAAWNLTGYHVQASDVSSANMMASAWLLQASNDEVRWTTIDSQTAQTAWGDFENRSYTPTATSTAWRFWRLYITGNNGHSSNTVIAQLYLYGNSATATVQDPDFAPHTMTSNALPTPYVASASSEASASYQAWRAFDGDSTPGGNPWTGTGSGTDYLQIDLGAGVSKQLTGYAVRGGFPGIAARAPKNWTLQGSPDGTTWTVLDTRTNQQNWQCAAWTISEVRSYSASSSAGYRYFRLSITANNGDATNTGVYELYLFGTTYTGVSLSIFSSNRDFTLWAQLQSGGTRIINNSSGTWTSTGAAKLRFNTFNLSQQNAVNTPTYKTGKRSPLLGLRGRQAGTFTLSKPFIPSGAAGTAPDDDPILQSFMGQAGTVVASTSVTYSLSDALLYLAFFLYNQTPGASSPTNSYVLGAVPQTVRFIGGGNFLDYEVQGVAVGVGDSVNFAAYTGGDAVLKGALTTYPAEPGSATQNGNVIAGFGSGAGFSIGGSALAEVRGTVDLTLSLGVEAIADALNDAYTIGFVGGLRQISLSNITCIDSDGSVLNALKAAAFTKAAQTIVLQFGNVAGSIVTLNLANVQIGQASWQEAGAALNIQFGESMAHASSSSTTNDLSIVCT